MCDGVVGEDEGRETLRGSERKKKDDKHSQNSIFNTTEIAPFNAAPGEFLHFSFNKRKHSRMRARVRVQLIKGCEPFISSAHRWTAPLKGASPTISRSVNQEKQLLNFIFAACKQRGFECNIGGCACLGNLLPSVELWTQPIAER